MRCSMRAVVLVLGLAVVLAAPAAARGQEAKFTEADMRKAEEELRRELRGPLMVYIIDAPREPFHSGSTVT